jgi:ketosteroid isomerase-like protein
MREQVIQVVEQYIDAVRHNDASALPLHPDAVCEFPTNTYRGAASFRKGLDDFARIMKSIEVIRLVVDGEHCVAIVNIDTVFGVIPFAEHIHVADGQIVSIASRASLVASPHNAGKCASPIGTIDNRSRRSISWASSLCEMLTRN